jgi:hypothetical protein
MEDIFLVEESRYVEQYFAIERPTRWYRLCIFRDNGFEKSQHLLASKICDGKHPARAVNDISRAGRGAKELS